MAKGTSTATKMIIPLVSFLMPSIKPTLLRRPRRRPDKGICPPHRQ